jgi:hypothetical protein
MEEKSGGRGDSCHIRQGVRNIFPRLFLGLNLDSDIVRCISLINPIDIVYILVYPGISRYTSYISRYIYPKSGELSIRRPLPPRANSQSHFKCSPHSTSSTPPLPPASMPKATSPSNNISHSRQATDDSHSRMSDIALRKKKNADAQAAFRARRANYIATLEETGRSSVSCFSVRLLSHF